MTSELLKLCGFEPQEAEAEQTRINRAFDIWGITAGDVKRAEERITRYFDLKLTGMRKIRGIWIKEFVDMTLAKDEGKIVVYSSFPPIAQINGSMATMSEKVYCSVPEPIILTVLGQYFGKLGSILEQAEKSWLPPGQAHCPFLQARLAGILGGMAPRPDLLIAMGITCDQAGKTDDLIGYLMGVPVVHVDSCNDEAGDHLPYPDPRRVRYLARELTRVAEMVRQVTGLELTEEAINQGNNKYNGLKVMYDKLQLLRGRADPLPMSEKDWVNIFDIISTCGHRVINEGQDALNILFKELKQRTDDGIGVLDKGAIRVCNLFPHSSDPAVTEVLEKAGLASVVNSGAPSNLSLPSEYDSIWEQIADKNLRVGPRASTLVYINQLKEHCREWKVEGLIIAALVKCRFYNIFPRKAKEIIEKELNIPVLAIELDNLDSREYTAEYLRTRVEPFAAMLKDRKKGSPRGLGDRSSRN